MAGTQPARTTKFRMSFTKTVGERFGANHRNQHPCLAPTGPHSYRCHASSRKGYHQPISLAVSSTFIHYILAAPSLPCVRHQAEHLNQVCNAAPFWSSFKNPQLFKKYSNTRFSYGTRYCQHSSAGWGIFHTTVPQPRVSPVGRL